MKYEIIVLDLDGTLTNRDKVITPATRDVLMKAQGQGKLVVLASGRPTYGVIPMARELELEKYGGYILSYNGGVIINCRTMETIFSSLLPEESNEKIIGLAKEHGVNILTYEGETIITPDSTDIYVNKEAAVNRMKVRQIENFKEHITFEVPKFLLLDDGDYLALVEPMVKAALGKNFSVYRSEPYFLEVLPKGIDKAKSLERLLGDLNLTREQMIACGDGYNDLTMIQYAGMGVAMGNAVLSIRKAANFITLSNDEEGVAHVVEKFLLESI